MVICVCSAVTERQIRECVSTGACSLRELRHRLGVASQCGKCALHARQLIEETVPAAGVTADAVQR